jgi:ketosteroid isomerase-like protein
MRALSLMVATGLLAACNQQSPAQDNAEEQLRAANAQYDQALVAGDAAALNRYYADDFQIIDDDGAVHDKKNQVQFMTQEVDLLNARGDDVKVTMLGRDSALVTGRFAGRYRYKGKEENFTERYTSVWVRKDGQWRVRHEHTSLLPEPKQAVTG